MDRRSSPRVPRRGVDARLDLLESGLDAEATLPHVATEDYPELGDLLSTHLPPRVYPDGFYGIDSTGAVICGPFGDANGPFSMSATMRVVSSQHLAVTWVVEAPDGERVAGPFATSTEATEALQQAKLDTGDQDLTVGQVTDEPEAVDTGFQSSPNARSTIPGDYTGIGLGDTISALAAADPDFRFEVTASWSDVRKKAVRLRDDGDVWLNAANPPHYAAVVQGDHGVYETTLMLTPGSHSIAMWTCGCRWASYSWGRSGRWKKFEGRTCSHTLALFYEMQSRGMFGKTVQDTPKRPEWAVGVKPKVWSPSGPPGEWRVGAVDERIAWGGKKKYVPPPPIRVDPRLWYVVVPYPDQDQIAVGGPFLSEAAAQWFCDHAEDGPLAPSLGADILTARNGGVAVPMQRAASRRVLAESSPGEAVLSTGNPPEVSDLVRQFAITPVSTDFFANEADDLSAAYRALPVVDPTVVALWERFGQVVTEQANQLRQQYQIIVRDDTDPYATAAEMHADIDSGTYQVCSLHSFHPIWDTATNVNFRIAHDILGHGGAHSDFSFKGEIEAYQSECAVTPVDLWPALFTEIVAQSAYANTHHLFGEQKVGLITLDQASIDAMVGTVMDGPDAAYDALHYSASALRPATDYGLTVDTSVSDHPAFQAAQQFTGWDSLPLTTVDPTQLIAAESDLNADAIDRVVSGDEPFREGYDPEVVRLPDGRLAIVDGNTRAAMYASLGRSMPVKVWDPSTSGSLDAEAAYYADADLWGGDSATIAHYDDADLWSDSLSREAWTPRGFSFKDLGFKVSDVSAARGAARVKAADTFDDRLGRCYEMAGRMVMNDGGTLVHGSIQGEGQPRIGHAWVDNGDGTITDPVLGETMPTAAYDHFASPQVEHRYTQEEVLTLAAKTGHWGPWESVKYPGKEAMLHVADADIHGCMVALAPPPEIVQALLECAGQWNPGVELESADQVHITLAYLPDFDQSRSDELAQVISTFALGAEPLTGTYQGFGVFDNRGDGEGAVLIALPDVPGLPEWRQRLVAYLNQCGFEVAENHGYTPHSTMAYVPLPTMPNVPNAVPAAAMTPSVYGTVELVIDDDWQSFPLTGITAEAMLGESVRHDEPEPALPVAYGDSDEDEDSDFSGRTSPSDLNMNSISPGQETGVPDDQIYTLPGSNDESLGSALGEIQDDTPESRDQTPIEQTLPRTMTDNPLAQVSRTDITDSLVQTNTQSDVDEDIGVAGHRVRHPRIAKVLPSAQQRALIDEGNDVLAANLDRLDITGTHYEALEDNDLLDWL